MARDKSRDDELFNCSQEFEHRYVYNLYPGNKEKVRVFLKRKCDDRTIKNFTHMQVYQLIKKKLDLPIPV